jgi:CcmD family protein|tara:strand:- start:857 stop:997 length:141 start_codon:yes stop_codon:yes gene_type:complete
MENLGYLLAAFSAAWAVVFAYLLLLLNRQKKLHQEINLLKEELKGK